MKNSILGVILIS
jgi:hypothetical protein